MSLKFTMIYAVFCFLLFACKTNIKTNTDIDENPYLGIFTKEYQEALNADQYGMSQYVMAYLKAGPNRSQDSTKRANLQKAHLDNIDKMIKEGSLILAGPFLDDGPIRGIYIFNVETIEEARALTSTDPAVQAGSLIMELHPWYGTAALKEVTKVQLAIWPENE